MIARLCRRLHALWLDLMIWRHEAALRAHLAHLDDLSRAVANGPSIIRSRRNRLGELRARRYQVQP